MPLHLAEHHVYTSDASYVNKLPPVNKNESAPYSKADFSIFSKKPTNAKRPANVGEDGQKIYIILGCSIVKQFNGWEMSPKL